MQEVGGKVSRHIGSLSMLAYTFQLNNIYICNSELHQKLCMSISGFVDDRTQLSATAKGHLPLLIHPSFALRLRLLSFIILFHASAFDDYFYSPAETKQSRSSRINVPEIPRRVLLFGCR